GDAATDDQVVQRTFKGIAKTIAGKELELVFRNPLRVEARTAAVTGDDVRIACGNLPAGAQLTAGFKLPAVGRSVVGTHVSLAAIGSQIAAVGDGQVVLQRAEDGGADGRTVLPSRQFHSFCRVPENHDTAALGVQAEVFDSAAHHGVGCQ